jgi:hypothetical protein
METSFCLCRPSLDSYVRQSDFILMLMHSLTLPIQFFCQPPTPQLLFVLGGKEVGGLLVIILRF